MCFFPLKSGCDDCKFDNYVNTWSMVIFNQTLTESLREDKVNA